MASELSRRGFLEKASTAAAASTGVAAVLAAGAAEAAQRKPLKIIGLCCSPRTGKSTATALKICLEAAQAVDAGIQTELIELGALKIPGEVAARVPLEEGQKDDFPPLARRLADASVAAIVIGTPVYFGNMSALCKAFLDRGIYFRMNNLALKNKIGGVVAVGGVRNGGQELTIRSVHTALISQQMIVVGDGPPTGHWGGTVWSGAGGTDADVTADEFGISTVKNLGRRVAEVALLLAKAAGG